MRAEDPSALPAGTVVVDAMGGDHAPEEVVAGAVAAAASGLQVVLCGPPERVGGAGLPVIASGPAVAMDDRPAIALRRDPDASVRVAARAVACNPGTALLSAGTTGATVAAALLELGRTPGVRRPVVAARIPLAGSGHVLLADAGAMPDPTPEHLRDTAALAMDHARRSGVTDPTCGLLNTGSEAGRGNELARRAHVLLDGTEGFVGNVEPGAVLAGAVDVVVTDGFTGNILLKALEAAMPIDGRRGAGDHAALVLGVRGTVLVAHGAARADQVARAVQMAATVAATGPRAGHHPVLEGP